MDAFLLAKQSKKVLFKQNIHILIKLLNTLILGCSQQKNPNGR